MVRDANFIGVSSPLGFGAASPRIRVLYRAAAPPLSTTTAAAAKAREFLRRCCCCVLLPPLLTGAVSLGALLSHFFFSSCCCCCDVSACAAVLDAHRAIVSSKKIPRLCAGSRSKSGVRDRETAELRVRRVRPVALRVSIPLQNLVVACEVVIVFGDREATA